MGAVMSAATPLWGQGNAQKVTSHLEIFDVVTNERTVLRDFPYLIEAPNWTPDGRFLVFNSGGKIYTLEIANPQAAPQLIPTGRATSCNNDHVLSADGKWLAVSSGTQDDWRSKIYVLPLEGGEAKLVTPVGPSYLHGWSPDGRTLAYCADRGGAFDVYVMALPAEGEGRDSGNAAAAGKAAGDAATAVDAAGNAAGDAAAATSGNAEVRLTTAEGLDDGPEYAPDGQHIWFNSVRTGLMQVWRMRADGSEQTQMTFDTHLNSWFPHVSPDGRNVVYICYYKGDLEPGQHLANKNVELRMMPAEGGASRLLCKLFGGQGTINVNSWAPDSRRFAFVSYSLE